MKLLIFVNKFDKKGDLLGFFTDWTEELAKNFKKITVITQEVGDYNKIDNLEVISINKNINPSPIKRGFIYWKLAFSLKSEYDAIFVIMAPSWVIMSWPIKTLLNKKLFLWYAVWKGSWKLRIAERIADKIFCSVRESFPIKSNKIVAIGQGINLNKFKPDPNIRKNNSILILGRISPVKKIEIILRAVGIMKNRDPRSFSLIGDVIISGQGMSAGDNRYMEELKKLSLNLGIESKITWSGKVTYDQLESYYQKGDIFINTTPTGSFDKVMLEAMACESIVIASNKALNQFYSEYLAEKLIFEEGDPADLSIKLGNVLNLGKDEKNKIRSQLRDLISENHSHAQWAKRLAANLNE